MRIRPTDVTDSSSNDELAEVSAMVLLQTLETPIQGRPTITVRNFKNAVRLIKSALLAVFEAKPQAFLPQDDDEPVTAEWLDGLEQYCRKGRVWRCEELKDYLFHDGHNWQLDTDGCFGPMGPTYRIDSRGQLRAWHKFSGQELKEVGK